MLFNILTVHKCWPSGPLHPGGHWQEVLFEKLNTMGHYLTRKWSDGLCSLSSICQYFCHTVKRNVAVCFQESSVFPAIHSQSVGNSESSIILVIRAVTPTGQWLEPRCGASLAVLARATERLSKPALRLSSLPLQLLTHDHLTWFPTRTRPA